MMPLSIPINYYCRRDVRGCVICFFLGMWGLEVSGNPITEIPSMAFYGLERALWELNLSNNQLTRIPTQSVAILKKLSVLVLAGE